MPKEMRQYKIARSISPHINAIKKILRLVTEIMSLIFMVVGLVLDEAKIAEAYQGVPQVYIRKGKGGNFKFCVVVGR